MNPLSADDVERAELFVGTEDAVEEEEGIPESPGPLAEVISIAIDRELGGERRDGMEERKGGGGRGGKGYHDHHSVVPISYHQANAGLMFTL